MRRLALSSALVVSPTLWADAVASPPTPAEFSHYAQTLLAGSFRADAPGVAVLVMRGDEVLYRGARGQADIAAGVPLEPGDRFRIGSVTKQIAAAGLLTLVDAGKVSLDAPLSTYVPAYPGGARITIEQLLNHTSGIKSYTDDGWRWGARVRRDLTTAQMVGSFMNERPDFTPGERWKYNNSGYVLVGTVIEVVTGQSWHSYLDQALFEPLGMTATGYGADPAVVAQQVNGYEGSGTALALAPQISMTQPHAAGALVSTVDDLVRWSRALHGGRVLSAATYARMITPVGKAKDAGYGFGLWTTAVRGVPAFQHDGGIPGFTAKLIHVPGVNVTVAVLHNGESPSSGDRTAALARNFAAAALGNPYPPVVPVAVDPALLRQYEGVYRVDDRATRTLRVVGTHLTAQRTDRPRERLTAISDDTFLYSDGFTRLQVLRDATGNVSAMRLWTDGEGEGALAPLTTQRLPIDVTRPAAEFARLARANPATLVVGAMTAMLVAAVIWRRRTLRGGMRKASWNSAVQ